MKKTLIIFILLFVSATIFAQGKGKEKQKEKAKNLSGQIDQVKGKDKDKGRSNQEMDDHDRRVWDGIGDNSCMLPSKNQPAKVRAAFYRDYPNAVNVRWTKCRGDWTATFANGFFRSTAVYHANGQRKDTRTPIRIEEAPKNIFDKIKGKEPNTLIQDVVKIEQPAKPGGLKDILYRVKTGTPEKTNFLFLNSSGEKVNYNY